MNNTEFIGKVKYIGEIEEQYELLLFHDKVYNVSDISTYGSITIDLDLKKVTWFSAPSKFFEIVEDEKGLLKEYGARSRTIFFD